MQITCFFNELVHKKNELLTLLESEQVIDDIEQLKEELLSFLNFDKLTTEILYRLVHKIVVSEEMAGYGGMGGYGCGGGYGMGAGFALIVVLFFLLIIVGTAYVY